MIKWTIGFIIVASILGVWYYKYKKANEVLSGKIIKKEYVPHKEWTTTYYQKIGKVSIPQTMHHEKKEHYEIVVEGRARNQKIRQKTIEISMDAHSKYEVGGRWRKKQNK